MKTETVELAKEKGFILEGDSTTQADLQKWLREEHYIHFYIHYGNLRKWCLDIYSISPHIEEDYLMNDPGEFRGYDTYEEVLEVGLQAALSKIKKDVLLDEIEKVVKAKTTS